MTYQEWYDDFGDKHKKIVDKLLERGMDKTRIIEYFDFENMLENEPNFCLLYAEKKKCHDIEKLNCYLCACPHFRFKDAGFEVIDGKTKKSYCAIDAKEGKLGVYGDAMHQDCSGCAIPHHKRYVEKNFKLEWREAMKNSPCETSDYSNATPS